MGTLDGRIDAVFADVDKPRHPGAALLVIDRGEVVYRKCYGCADLETERPITPDTSFYLASISKQFTAMAVMMLAEQGQLGLEDRLAAHFPGFPSWGAEITLRHMLHHTSGLPDYLHFIEPDGLIGVTNQDVLERVMDFAGPEFPAGMRFAYSNTAYALLATIAAAVAGSSFAAFLKANIFDPLGMDRTLVYDGSWPAHHKLAHGYMEEKGRSKRWDYPLLTVGDGGLFSTLDDLLLWDQALNTECLVPKTVLERAFTSGTANDGTPLHYGFGWDTNIVPGLRHVAHGGTLGAYSNYIIRFLDTRCTIIILTNRGPVPPVWQPGAIRGPRLRALEVARILFGY